MSVRPHATILYDGDCGLCEHLAGWVRRRDAAGRFEVVPYQRAAIDERLWRACAKALHVVTPSGRELRAGQAALYVLNGLGYRRLAHAFARQPLLAAVDVGYRVVAANRGLVSRTCGLGRG
jgi:predicted DCC family thiol-disulfide oxidoreductase YuxK